MSDWEPYLDDDDDDVIIGPPIPTPYVCAHLHGGPCDGETMMLPWARVEIVTPDWRSVDPSVASPTGPEWYLYRLSAPWRGQARADYDYVEPEPPEAPRMRPRRRSVRLGRLVLVLEWRR